MNDGGNQTVGDCNAIFVARKNLASILRVQSLFGSVEILAGTMIQECNADRSPRKNRGDSG
jgi:hypothetical protein